MLLSLMTLENDLQIAVNDYLNYLSKSYKFRHFHVPNEGNRPVSYKVKLKKMGLKAGCPDIVIEYPQGKILYIELKTKKGRLSDSQKLWAIQSKAMGTPHYIVQGEMTECLDEIKSIIKKNIPVGC